MARIRIPLALSVLGIVLLAWSPPPAAAQRAVVDGKTRFEVITPSLIRLEFAADGQFERRPSLTTAGRLPTRPSFRTRIGGKGSVRVIRTKAMTLRYERGSGPIAKGNLRATLGNRTLRPKPGPNPAPLGGWRRSLDLIDGPVPLHEGMLSRAGWYLLDDSETVLLQGNGFRSRPQRDARYQDLYLFAYGDDYARGLRDLRTLTGPAPVLPRKAFGVWFSRWWPYGEDDWKGIAARFRSERVPLDTISLDTDFKRVNDEAGAAIAATAVGAPGLPYSWNGWDWNRELYPDPARFFDWAKRTGLEVGLNIHPSISSSDPRFADAQAKSGGGLTASDGCRLVQADSTGECMVFDWTDPRQLEAYFDLHEPFERGRNLFFWLDWCCDGSSAEAPGLTADTWINRNYALHQRKLGTRWPAFSRIGGSFQQGFDGSGGTGAFAEHHYAIQFTGDTCASWPLLEFAAEYTAGAASIGMPYVSHDIGTFHAVSPTDTCDKDASPFLTPRFNSLPADMYVRWVQLGAFQPLDRLHSHHGKRLPWEYPEREGSIAAEFLRLRGTLVPYLYTLARTAHDRGLPMVRPLYLHWPRQAQAYERPSQYTLGRDVLVAPVAEPGNRVAKRVWFPPGTWVDWFTGKRYRGPSTERLTVPLERMPVFVRAGAIVPTQPERPTSDPGAARSLVLLAHRGNGRGTIYDDSGKGFGYERGAHGRTKLRQRRSGGATTITVGALEGSFPGKPRARRFEIRVIGVGRPRKVTIDGRATKRFRYDAKTRTAIVEAGRRPSSRSFRVVVR